MLAPPRAQYRHGRHCSAPVEPRVRGTGFSAQRRHFVMVYFTTSVIESSVPTQVSLWWCSSTLSGDSSIGFTSTPRAWASALPTQLWTSDVTFQLVARAAP